MMKDHKFLVDQVAGIDTLSLILKFFKGVDESHANEGDGIIKSESLTTNGSLNTEAS